MNKAADIISSDMLGESRSFITIGTRTIPIYPMTIEQIVRAFRHGALVEFNKIGNGTQDFEAMCLLAPQTDKMIRVIAEAVVRGRYRLFKLWRVRRMLRDCTASQIHENFQVVMRMSGAKEVFRCAALMSGAATMIATTEETKR